MRSLKHFFSLLFLLTLFIFFNSCKSEDIPEGTEADFTHFEFVYIITDTDCRKIAEINRRTKTIFAEIDGIADLKNLRPVFVLTHGATAYINNIKQTSGESANDFSTIVEYIVVSADGKNQQK